MHDLEIGNNGEVAFASLREPAWHGLGTVFDEPLSTKDMLSAAYLNNWNIRLVEVDQEDYNYSNNAYFVIRDNPFPSNTGKPCDILGIVGSRYRIFQNEDLFAFADNILDGGGIWETAGAIRNGRVVFGSMSMDRDVILDPNGVADTVKTYLLVHTSHDGSVSVQATVTPVRVVCQNTLNLSLRTATNSFKVRHTETVSGRIDEARRTLNLFHSYVDNFSEFAKSLYEVSVTDAAFDEIIKAAYPKPDADNKGSMTKWVNKVDTIMGIYNGPTTVGIRNTGWGALNAMTERLDWYRNGRTDNGESILAAASGFDAAINAEKNRLNGIVSSYLVSA